ncbi:MAG TPA: TIGR00366 family protein [Verrucomicrobiae bacterium]|jgi:short-chain fatty acids transporter|nr:TIGR00366 family protein [Verrucomicrobiae bacterium]
MSQANPHAKPGADENKIASTPFARLGSALADWSERWFPDAFIFALLATVVVFLVGVLSGSPAKDMLKFFGEGFWSLIPFTMQMVMIIVGGYVVASSPPVYRLILWLANIPATPRGAVAFVALVSTSTSLISYGFSLIFAGFLAREIARRLSGADYRALGAAAYLGLGSVWALGLSSSAALLMATKTAMPPTLLKISGLIPLSQTIYSWQSILTAVILLIVAVTVAYFSAPTGASVRTAESFGVTLEPMIKEIEPRRTPGEWLEYTPVLTVLICLLGFAYLGQVIAVKGPRSALDLNTYNLMFLMLGMLLHWRPRSFTRAVSASVPATAGVLIQFPFYAGIFGIISVSPISKIMADFFVRAANHDTYPVFVAIYSATLGLFVPSGGGKWLIEAPYIMAAANDLKVHLGWIVQVYNTAEALPNLINPFWMLPLLGILKMKARDLVGYGLLQLLVLAPVALFLMWLLAHTFSYVPPVVP